MSELAAAVALADKALADRAGRNLAPCLIPPAVIVVDCDPVERDRCAARLREIEPTTPIELCSDLADVAMVLARRRVEAAFVAPTVRGVAMVRATLAAAGAVVLPCAADVPAVEVMATVAEDGSVDTERHYLGFSPPREPLRTSDAYRPAGGRGNLSYRLRDAVLVLTVSVVLPSAICSGVVASAVDADGAAAELASGATFETTPNGLAVLVVHGPKVGHVYTVSWESSGAVAA